MPLNELKQRLDQLAWQEQLEHELGERPSLPGPDLELVPQQLRQLAAAIDSPLLEALEREAGYLVWYLRLAPYVDPAGARRRALPYLDDASHQVRYWATVIE